MIGLVFKKVFPKHVVSEIELDEDIDNYWASLDNDHRNWTICEEKNSRELFSGLKMLTDEQFERVKQVASNPEKNLTGVHSYDILANPLYHYSFQYISSSVEDRGKFILDGDDDESNDMAQSDTVRVALNLAYLPEKEARDIRLDKEGFVAGASVS